MRRQFSVHRKRRRHSRLCRESHFDLVVKSWSTNDLVARIARQRSLEVVVSNAPVRVATAARSATAILRAGHHTPTGSNESRSRRRALTKSTKWSTMRFRPRRVGRRHERVVRLFLAVCPRRPLTTVQRTNTKVSRMTVVTAGKHKVATTR